MDTNRIDCTPYCCYLIMYRGFIEILQPVCALPDSPRRGSMSLLWILQSWRQRLSPLSAARVIPKTVLKEPVRFFFFPQKNKERRNEQSQLIWRTITFFRNRLKEFLLCRNFWYAMLYAQIDWHNVAVPFVMFSSIVSTIFPRNFIHPKSRENPLDCTLPAIATPGGVYNLESTIHPSRTPTHEMSQRNIKEIPFFFLFYSNQRGRKLL